MKVVVTDGAGSIDSNLAEEFLKKHEAHQVTMASVQRSVDNPIASKEANVEEKPKVLVAARDFDLRKVVYASPSSAYGA